MRIKLFRSQSFLNSLREEKGLHQKSTSTGLNIIYNEIDRPGFVYSITAGLC